MAGSIDLIAIFLGGNIEILLIAFLLFARRLIWRHHTLWAAPTIAAVILVKPQFALLFLALGCLSAFTGSPVHRFTGSPVRWFAGSPVHQFASSCLPVCRFTGSPVHRVTGSPFHRFATPGSQPQL